MDSTYNIRFVIGSSNHISFTMATATSQRKRHDLTLAEQVQIIHLLDRVPKLSQAEVATAIVMILESVYKMCNLYKI